MTLPRTQLPEHAHPSLEAYVEWRGARRGGCGPREAARAIVDGWADIRWEIKEVCNGGAKEGTRLGWRMNSGSH